MISDPEYVEICTLLQDRQPRTVDDLPVGSAILFTEGTFEGDIKVVDAQWPEQDLTIINGHFHYDYKPLDKVIPLPTSPVDWLQTINDENINLTWTGAEWCVWQKNDGKLTGKYSDAEFVWMILNPNPLLACARAWKRAVEEQS